jgi:rod shape-determining protein MreB
MIIGGRQIDFNPFNKFWSTFSYDIGIDLGTANTLVYVSGKGILIREPTVVAAHKKTKQILAVGTQAKKMLGKTPALIIADRPIKDGVINDLDLAEGLLKNFIKKAHTNHSSIPKIPRPKVVIGIPGQVTEVERRAVSDAAVNAGAREVYLIAQPLAAAIGAKLPINEPRGTMIVDIGGGTTEIAVISLGGMVVNKSLRIAGDEMDDDIVSYARSRYNLLLGHSSAEEIKLSAGSAYPVGKEERVTARGRDLATGLPSSISMSTGEVREAISNTIRSIVEAIKEVMETSPPELVGDIADEGIYLSGGGALLKGLPNLLAKELKIPIVVVDEPLTAVVRGIAKVLEDPEYLKNLKV